MTIIEYVTEEVRRHGHDVAQRDGMERVAWMLEAWSRRLNWRAEDLTFTEIEVLGMEIEPHRNRIGIRPCRVCVGKWIAPEPEAIPLRITRLLAMRPNLAPLDFYREFEEIHPFIDGNGRTGKILLNVLNGTMREPIFPPPDFWGEKIQNP